MRSPDSLEGSREKANTVAPSRGDIHAAVAAFEPLARDLVPLILSRLQRRGFGGGERQAYRGVPTPTAPHVHTPPILGIQVEHGFPLEHSAFQLLCAREPCLFVNSEQTLEGRQLRGRRHCQESKSGCHTNPVVSAECGALGRDPVAFAEKRYGVLGEIMSDVVVLLGHHVHVSLDDYRGSVLSPSRTRSPDNHVPNAILLPLQLVLLRDGLQPRQNLLLFFARSRDGRELAEAPPQLLRLQSFQHTTHVSGRDFRRR
mmetsp:Transcript_19157/g.36960  ORF Transcript_19157/g.36960 Transcript_19157/m.36960 type:complete len:258 (-) Transcript_19157:149-922(-)